MLYEWIGDSNFATGMHNYLKRFSYSAASTEDLWTELEAAANLPVTKVMKDWTGRMGFPIIEAEIEEQTEDSVTIKLSQSKFSTIAKSAEISDEPWNVPIEILSSSGKMNILIDQKINKVKIEKFKSENGWIMINSGAAGFFHTKYSADLTNRLMKNLENLKTVDRLKLSSDLYCLCRAGVEPSDKYLKLFQAYSAETEYSVLSDILDGIETFKSFADYLQVGPKLDSIIISTISSCAGKIGWAAQECDTHTTPLLRALLLRHLGLAKHQETVKHAQLKFSDFKSKPESLDPNLKSTVFAICAANSNSIADFLELHAGYDLQEEKDRIEVSIGSVKKTELIEKVIDFAFGGSVRHGDIPHTLTCLARGSREGRIAVWNIIQKKIDFLKDKLGGQFLLSGLLKSVLSGFDDENQIKEIEKFFKENPVSNASMAIKQGSFTKKKIFTKNI